MSTDDGEGPPPNPTAPTPPTPPVIDEPLLPTTATDGDLAAAIGARPARASRRPSAPLDEDEGEDDLPAERRRRRTLVIVSGAALVVGIGIAVLVLLGRVNANRYYLRCTTTHAIAEQGRAFPPWGSSPLPGAEWRKIPLPADARCKAQELPDLHALESAFLDVLLERTSAVLAVPDLLAGNATASLDLASQQLEQALLLSRAPERGDQRKQVERLQGDVLYGRATLRLRDANANLVEAARQLDQAALARPMHVSDAASWATLVRRVADELRAGPAGASAMAAPSADIPPGRTPAPTGTALPVEPTPGEPAPADTPDAGVPSGGVLL